ncbi:MULTISPECIES: PEP/pyruvate-binding domain-containing protein [Sorangium]|uniref:Phosphoenolpyruvate synthase n=1 Tax=Sorangium cellulosum TaxID=56 RepID=A0A4P2R2D3_SORCE|nr:MULTISPECIES: PEP/pyruvate-binding domain-containing protein [Sorangium]AUX37157.1 phosphoenolpyruvate synthase [Sorangium cellulosum]WCQ96447.1 Prodigiosin synthesizing transferase PigC [Sorangium sp. Soce836]
MIAAARASQAPDQAAEPCYFLGNDVADPTRIARAESATDPPSVREWLKPLESAGQRRSTSAKRVGGKAASLGRLLRDGFPVPRGWVLDARCFTELVDRQLPRGHDLATLIRLSGTKVGVDRAARARDRILSEPLPEALSAALQALWQAVAPEAPWGLAVRSSATCEDSDETSMAGLATSVLGVRGDAELDAAIRQVWASAFLPRALAYLAHAGVRDVAMGVVLQVMVRAEAAGVLFTAPPAGLEGEHWRAGERLVNATLGLGAPVVDGAVAADTLRIARGGGKVVAAAVAQKRRALVVGAAGLEEVAVPAARAEQPALGEAALRQLTELAERLEQGGKGPFDVEFAVEGEEPGHVAEDGAAEGAPAEDGAAEGAPTEGAPAEGAPQAPRVWLLQVRPVSGGGFPEGGGADTIWSRANVGEALPGAATPLTWSVARAFSDRGFREAFAALGCRVPRGARLIANVHGRFYLNLTAFMQIAAQVPGLSPRALLGMSGGASDQLIARLAEQSAGVSRRRFYARLPLTGPRLLLRQARLEREVAAYEGEALWAQRALSELDMTLLPDDAIGTTLRSVFLLLERTGTLMLHCASASLASHLALCKALERVAGRRASARSASGEAPLDGPAGRAETNVEHLAQVLAGGVRELDSAGPGVELARVAELVMLDRASRERLLAGEVRGPRDLPEGPARDALARFLEAHGDRAVREAELATPRWREDPAPVIAMLTASLRGAPGDPERALARARALADREMAMLETRVSRVELALLRALVGRAQRYVRLRERMRTWVTRVLGMLRKVALDIDRRLLRIEPSLLPGSVFFCTYEELVTALSSGRADVGHVVRLRRAEHLRDAARPDPPATFIGRPPPVVLPPASGVRLLGLPASPGVVEGRARVLDPGAPSLDAVEPGEVLVARTTDIGLSPLFLVAAAVVTELGGPMSHASIVAREYGIPAVVNVPGATLAIKTGDRLRVDGDRGVVERLNERDERAAPPAPNGAAGGAQGDGAAPLAAPPA